MRLEEGGGGKGVTAIRVTLCRPVARYTNPSERQYVIVFPLLEAKGLLEGTDPVAGGRNKSTQCARG